MDGGVAMPVKVNGLTSGSVTVAAPDTGSDVTLTLPGSTMDLATELASKLPIAGGKILQIVRATDTTNRTTTSGTLVDASISVTITPQKSDSAVLLIWSFNHNVNGSGSLNGYRARAAITDNSNNMIAGAEDSLLGWYSLTTTNTSSFQTYCVLIGYASPATTSAVTYKGRHRSEGGVTSGIENASRTGQLFAIEVSA